MTREERDKIVIPLLNERPKKKVAKKRKPGVRPPDAKMMPVPPEPEKAEKPSKSTKK